VKPAVGPQEEPSHVVAAGNDDDEIAAGMDYVADVAMTVDDDDDVPAGVDGAVAGFDCTATAAGVDYVAVVVAADNDHGHLLLSCVAMAVDDVVVVAAGYDAAMAVDDDVAGGDVMEPTL
jgi:hypothetical protein